MPGAAQHLLLALADDSDYEDPAWEEELASPAGQMADKVGVGAGRGWGGEQGACRDTPMVVLVLVFGHGLGSGRRGRVLCEPTGLLVHPNTASLWAGVHRVRASGRLQHRSQHLLPGFGIFIRHALNSCGSGLILGAAAR